MATSLIHHRGRRPAGGTAHRDRRFLDTTVAARCADMALPRCRRRYQSISFLHGVYLPRRMAGRT